MKKISLPEDIRVLESLRAGEEVCFSGVVYTARDQAHQRLCRLIERKARLPFDLKGAVIYYCGPTDTPPGSVIGSCGPTTSRRMDAFTPLLLENGVKAMIGKGGRSETVRLRIRKSKAVYFVTYAGCGALLARHVVSKSLCAFGDLGPEAVYRLEVRDFPLVTAIDSSGGVVTQAFSA